MPLDGRDCRNFPGAVSLRSLPGGGGGVKSTRVSGSLGALSGTPILSKATRLKAGAGRRARSIG